MYTQIELRLGIVFGNAFAGGIHVTQIELRLGIPLLGGCFKRIHQLGYDCQTIPLKSSQLHLAAAF